MTRPLLAVLASLSVASAASALSPEVGRRAQAALESSSIGPAGFPDSPEAPLPQGLIAAQGALASRPVFRAAIELTGVCRNQQLRTPGWCPKAGQPVDAADGGVTVSVNDDVDFELTVPLLWAVGRHAFMIVSVEALRRPDPKPAFGTVVDFGVPGIGRLKFRADRPGDYVFFEPYGRSVTGRFTVLP